MRWWVASLRAPSAFELGRERGSRSSTGESSRAEGPFQGREEAPTLLGERRRQGGVQHGLHDQGGLGGAEPAPRRAPGAGGGSAPGAPRGDPAEGQRARGR